MAYDSENPYQLLKAELAKTNVISEDFKGDLLGWMMRGMQFAADKAREEERVRHEPDSSIDKERYRKNAQGSTVDPCGKCGHQYYRHFDWMEEYFEHCKYCSCGEFQEAKPLTAGGIGLYGGGDK